MIGLSSDGSKSVENGPFEGDKIVDIRKSPYSIRYFSQNRLAYLIEWMDH